MPDWIKTTGHCTTIGVLLFDSFSNHCLANAVEPLRAANGILGRQVYRWELLTLDGAPVTSSSGIAVTPGGKLSEASGDALALLPSYGVQELSTDACARSLRAATHRFRTLIGLDTGSWMLAHAGLLDGAEAVIHFEEFDAFSERFPEVHAKRKRWIRTGRFWSAGGAIATFELLLDFMSEEHGAALTLEVAALFMHTDAEAPRIAVPPFNDRIVAAALATMEASIEEPVSIGVLAQSAGCPQRELERRFDKALGATPRTVYRRLRLNRARRLLAEEYLGVSEIALRCGYADSSAFARAFRREFGESPREARG